MVVLVLGLSDTVLEGKKEVCGGLGRDMVVEVVKRRRLYSGLSVVFLLEFTLPEKFGSSSSICDLFQPPRHSLG
jgi:hypothetical protein